MADQLLYLSAADVDAFTPAPLAAVDLVASAMMAIGRGDAQLSHSVMRMPGGAGLSSIVGALQSGPAPLAGQKWVSESTTHGVSALMMMNDPETGLLHTLMDARGLTGLRTAAVSGACVRALARPGDVAIVGTGLQCRYHLLVLAALNVPAVRIAYARRASADAIAEWAEAEVPGMTLTFHADRREAVAGAATILTMVRRGTAGAEIAPEWVSADALLLPVDFAHCITGGLAARAAIVAADHPGTYEEARAHGELPGYPVATCATGEALMMQRPAGMVLVQNLGNAAADLVIAEHIRNAALTCGAGILLDR
jgi:ornithine cyclodeaminase/alanine dehydrogenase-like protein (mu-crystallin family)